jgi:hypothetical protein
MKDINDMTGDELRAQGVTIVEDESELWRIKREGQARSRQLVREGKRSQESMFLFSREVVKNSKIKWRG